MLCMLFSFIALKQFGLDDNVDGVFMCDQDGALISTELYETILLQYKNCNHFAIKIRLTGDITQDLDMVSQKQKDSLNVLKCFSVLNAF